MKKEKKVKGTSKKGHSKYHEKFKVEGTFEDVLHTLIGVKKSEGKTGDKKKG